MRTLVESGQVLRDLLEAAHEEIAHGDVGADGTGQHFLQAREQGGVGGGVEDVHCGTLPSSLGEGVPIIGWLSLQSRRKGCGSLGPSRAHGDASPCGQSSNVSNRFRGLEFVGSQAGLRAGSLLQSAYGPLSQMDVKHNLAVRMRGVRQVSGELDVAARVWLTSTSTPLLKSLRATFAMNGPQAALTGGNNARPRSAVNKLSSWERSRGIRACCEARVQLLDKYASPSDPDHQGDLNRFALSKGMPSQGSRA